MGDSVKSLFSRSSNDLVWTTRIWAGSSNPSEFTVTRETVVITETDETMSCEFRILSETQPQVFLLSGDNQCTNAHIDVLKTSLAGTLLLAEHDGRYCQRILAWLRRYGLRRHVATTLPLWIPEKVRAVRREGWDYWIVGASSPIRIHESLLQGRFSGRLLIREFTKQPPVFFFWQEIRRKAIPCAV